MIEEDGEDGGEDEVIDDDSEHGNRAAQLITDLPGLAEPLNEEKRRERREAFADHDRGLTTANPTIACCWDADRLDLSRVGIEPDPELMSTEAGRKRAQQFAVRSTCDYEVGEPFDAALAPQ
jgi:hypothetical protein